MNRHFCGLAQSCSSYAFSRTRYIAGDRRSHSDFHLELRQSAKCLSWWVPLRVWRNETREVRTFRLQRPRQSRGGLSRPGILAVRSLPDRSSAKGCSFGRSWLGIIRCLALFRKESLSALPKLRPMSSCFTCTYCLNQESLSLPEHG